MYAQQAAQELIEIQEQIKLLQHRAEGIKAGLKEGLEIGDFVMYGSISVELSLRERASLDRASLEAKFGKDVILRFERVTPYLELKVRKLA